MFFVFFFGKSFWTCVFVFWHLSFGEIVLHGDSTTAALISKNNVFLICFILNGVFCFSNLISWQGIRHLLSILYGKNSCSLRIRHFCRLFFCKIVLDVCFYILSSLCWRSRFVL